MASDPSDLAKVPKGESDIIRLAVEAKFLFSSFLFARPGGDSSE